MDLFDFSDGHVKQLEATVILEYYNNNNNSNNVYFIHPSGKLKLSFDLRAHNEELNCTYLNNSKQ